MTEAMIETALKKGRNVLMDNTHTRKEFLMQLVTKFRPIADISFKIFDVPLEDLLARNAVRERKVPKDVIQMMYRNLQELKKDFDFSPLPKAGTTTSKTAAPQDLTLPKAVLCDLDGTLALTTGRNMFRPTEEEMYADTVNEAVAQALLGMAQHNKIIFLSGREDLYFDICQKWIKEKAQIADFELFMRKENDPRKDNIVKEEILMNDILTRYQVTAVFDDRMQVCRMWYEKGIFCFNVNQGLVEF
jgi:hypothetical protein